MRRAVVVILFVLIGCRSSRPPNAEPIVPLTASSPSEAEQQLARRRAQFRGERSLIRIRLPQISARGQLQVDSDARMLMTVYTPLGTTAARLYVDGEDVIFLNDFDSTAWRGKTSELPGNLSVFGSRGMTLYLIGLPRGGSEVIEYSPTGLQSVHLQGTAITYDPPVYPPKRVSIDRGARHVEIEHLESFVDSRPFLAPEIPRDYRCCVLPQI